MKEKYLYWKRGVALILAAALAFTGLPANVRAAAEPEETLIRFDFNEEPADGVFTSGDVKATVQGGCSLQERDQANGKALYLDGSSGFLNVAKSDGSSPLKGLEEVTISFDTKQDRTATNWPFYAAPDTKAPTNGKEHYLGALINSGNITVERYCNTNGRPKNPSAVIGNDWVHIDVVVTKAATELYVNGMKKSTVDSTYQIQDIVGAEGGIFQIGKANWGNGEYCKGWIDNFEIRGKALAESEITTDEVVQRIVSADAGALKLPETVKQDFALPEKGANGSTISWSVEANDYIKIEGSTAKVTRSTERDGEAKLTATVSRKKPSGQDVTETKLFTVKVEQLLNEAEAAKKQLVIPNLDNVRGNITLPSRIVVEDYENVTAEIAWKSEDTDVIADAPQDGKPAGVVTRQAQDTQVKLTATITANGKTATKDFTAKVKAANHMQETTDYLFAFFENNGGPAQQQIFLASSHDGNNWLDLYAKKPVLSVADSQRSEEDLAKNQNQAGVRDPYIIRSPEGDRFWIIATDLCIGANNIAAGTVDWGVSQFSGSHCLRIWESDDLVHWSEPWLADVAPKDTTCAWAPEAVYDETTGEYVVFFASMTTMDVKDDAGNNKKVQKVYYAKTRDFRTFTEPVKMVDNGEDHIIDTTIIKAADGIYYRGSAADGSIRLEKCKDGNWKGLDSWEAQGSVREIAQFSGNLEGPELFQYNEDDYKEVNGEKKVTYGLLADNYGSLGYVPFYTTDIANAAWVKTDDNDYNFDTVHKRHGGILNLTAEEYDRVMEAYGPQSIAVKTAPNPLAYDVAEKTFDPSGLVLEVTYANGQKETIAYPMSGKNGRQFTITAGAETVVAGEQEITVTYGEKSTKFQTTVELDESGLPQPHKVLAEFDFDDDESGFSSESAKAVGSHALKQSYAESMGNALYLDGTSANYLSVTDKEGNSLLAGQRELTISYDMKPDATSTNWVMYAAPDDNKQVNNSEKYLGVLEKNGTTTVERYLNSGKRPTNPSAATGSKWHHVDIVLSKTGTTIYLNGQKAKEEASAYALHNILGKTGVFYIGKANWGDSGEYFKGYLDNFTVRNWACAESEISALSADFLETQPLLAEVLVGTAPDRETALTYRGTDDHTAVTTLLDYGKKEIQPYIQRGTDLTNIPVEFGLNGTEITIKVAGSDFQGKGNLDLSEDVQVVFSKAGKGDETWTMKKPIYCNNPVLPGQYADPDIDYFDGKFWIYPTTDGYPGWSGTKFHAFSSVDMVEWEDEGIIMELANDNPGVNDKGVQIAVSPWAVNGSAWAPTIEKRNGKYYFYYCGKDSAGASQIGVAVADHPAGPYTDKGTPLVTTKMCHDLGLKISQAIDPSIFADDDGSVYMSFGNGGGGSVLAKLTEDMMDIEEGSLKQITGLTDFRESVVITKIDGKYHWTWSCDDANSPNYHVNYGVSDKLIQDDGTVKVTLKKKNLLSKDESKNILGSAHQSVVHVKDASGKDRYFMAYHRFYTPLNIFTTGLGVHRTTCIDEITFDENGEMVITPTLEGVSAVEMPATEPVKVPVSSVTLDKTSITLEPGRSEKLTATVLPANAGNKSLSWKSDNDKVAAVDQNGNVMAKAAGTATVTATSANGVSASCKVTVKAAGQQPKPPVPGVSSVKLNKSKLTLGVGEKFTLQATVSPKNAAGVTWNTSNKKIVTVKNGKLVAKKKGTATITATAGGKKATCKVTVKAAPDKKAKVSLNKKSVTLKLKGKKTFQIKAKISGKKYGCNGFKYTVDKKGKKAVKVDKNGKVTAKKKGKATITVKPYNKKGKSAKLKVTVK